MVYLSAVPAYGRDYKSQKAVLADWNAGKDFYVEDMRWSGYVSKGDLGNGVVLNIRYDKLRKVLPVKGDV